MEKELSEIYVADDGRYDGRMEYERVGRSGLKMPKVSLGLWHNFGTTDVFENMRAIVRTAFDAGITLFDVANNYGPVAGAAERNFGQILKGDFKAYRDQMVVTTKAGYWMWDGPYGDFGSRKYLISSIDQSLQRLGLDYVDIFYHHRPDPETPIEETALALDQIVRSGKALYVGLSNYNSEQMRAAMEIFKELKTPFIINQVSYNIFNRWIEADGLIDEARREGVGLTTFSPLDQGLLTDRYLDGIPADSRVAKDGRFLHEEDVKAHHAKIVELNAIAQSRGQSLAQMALAWILRDENKGAVSSVLIGASKPAQVLDCAKAIENTAFSDEELAAIDAIAPVK